MTVLQSNTKRDVGKKAQSGNIMAAKVWQGSNTDAMGQIREGSSFVTSLVCLTGSGRHCADYAGSQVYAEDAA